MSIAPESSDKSGSVWDGLSAPGSGRQSQPGWDRGCFEGIIRISWALGHSSDLLTPRPEYLAATLAW